MSVNSKNIYVAIIGDIIDSKKIKNRNEVQQKLKHVLSKINQSYDDIIAANFIISLGDEFQGLLCQQEKVFEIINDIEMNMFPIKIRFGIGVGKIDTDILKNNTLEIAGPAYYNARKSISILNKKKKNYEKIVTNAIINSGEQWDTQDELINSILSLIYISKSKWTKNAVNVIKTYIKNNYNQYDVAKELGVQQPAISKTLKNCYFYTINHSYNVLHNAMKERDDNDNHI